MKWGIRLSGKPANVPWRFWRFVWLDHDLWVLFFKCGPLRGHMGRY